MRTTVTVAIATTMIAAASVVAVTMDRAPDTAPSDAAPTTTSSSTVPSTTTEASTTSTTLSPVHDSGHRPYQPPTTEADQTTTSTTSTTQPRRTNTTQPDATTSTTTTTQPRTTTTQLPATTTSTTNTTTTTSTSTTSTTTTTTTSTTTTAEQEWCTLALYQASSIRVGFDITTNMRDQIWVLQYWIEQFAEGAQGPSGPWSVSFEIVNGQASGVLFDKSSGTTHYTTSDTVGARMKTSDGHTCTNFFTVG